MARAPEPLNELLPRAAAVVEADVVAVLETGPEPPQVHRPGWSSTGQRSPAQRVRLRVGRVLRGSAAGEVVAVKPEAPYLLSEGNHGLFMLDAGEPVASILGRYGPDSYVDREVEAALAQGAG